MNNTIKQTIAQEVKELSLKSSQNKVATSAGVSSATISQILNNKWELIADEMWRKIQTNLNITLGWNIAATKNLTELLELLKTVQARSLAIGIAYDAGAGKSVAYRKYAREHANVIYIECKNYWTKKSYVKHLCKACGIKSSVTLEEMVEDLQDYIATLQNAFVIIDQFDKLKESSMDLFMDLYNTLEGRCAFLLSGVPALEKRIVRGVQHDKIGYRELYSRIGRKFIKLQNLTLQDVSSICNANGLADKEEIKFIFKNSDGDIRRVRRDVERNHILNAV